MADEIRGARSEFPIHRPADHIIAGIIEDAQETQLAVDELNALGFSEDFVFVLHGESGAEELRRRGHDSGPLYRLWIRVADFTSASGELLQRDIEAAEQGSYVIVIFLAHDEDRTRELVYRTLKSHGGHNIVRVGRSFAGEFAEGMDH